MKDKSHHRTWLPPGGIVGSAGPDSDGAGVLLLFLSNLFKKSLVVVTTSYSAWVISNIQRIAGQTDIVVFLTRARVACNHCDGAAMGILENETVGSVFRVLWKGHRYL